MTRAEMTFWIYLANKIATPIWKLVNPEEADDARPIERAWEEAHKVKRETDKT